MQHKEPHITTSNSALNGQLYRFGHDGNRAIKMTGNAAIDQTGTLLNSTNLENITIYPNEYLTVTQAEYTKYYYAGGNRIASKIGTGGLGKMQRLCTQDLNLSSNVNTLFGNVLQQVVNTANQPTDEYPVDVCNGYSVSAELLTNPLPDFYISQTNLNFTQNNLLQQFRQNLTNSVEPVYYFHSDHLGSASWITDGTGTAVQHLQYLPFGEHFVNEQSSGYFERFTFTGKERDAETGYYYHGARFNSSDIGWLSVDPLADKYPEITPYHYCHWNPIKIIDPTGMFDDEWKYDTETKKLIWMNFEGGEDYQTVHLESNNKTSKTVCFKGQIQDMFDFPNVISSQFDKIIDGALQMFSAASTIVGGVAIGVSTEGLGALPAIAFIAYGGTQFSYGLKAFFEGVEGNLDDDKYLRQDIIRTACCIATDWFGYFLEKRLIDKTLNEGVSMASKFLRGFTSIGLEAAWSVIKIINLKYPTLKKQLPAGSSIKTYQ